MAVDIDALKTIPGPSDTFPPPKEGVSAQGGSGLFSSIFGNPGIHVQSPIGNGSNILYFGEIVNHKNDPAIHGPDRA
jgi:hypothetical protein